MELNFLKKLLTPILLFDQVGVFFFFFVHLLFSSRVFFVRLVCYYVDDSMLKRNEC